MMMDCDGPDCLDGDRLQFDDEPPEFIRAPPAFLCDLSYRSSEELYTCGNVDNPFPFRVNADGSSSAAGGGGGGAEATLVVALVCAVILSLLLTTSGVFLWRNRKHLRKYLTCRTRSPTSSSSSRKGTPSAASTSDGASSEGGAGAAAYSDNIEYKKKTLLAAISSPSGVKFLTDSAIRYAPAHLLLDPAHQHHQYHQQQHGQHHIYEEIPNNYQQAGFPASHHHHHPHHHAYPRYAVFRDGHSGGGSGTPLSHQAFAQRQSWLDLLQRPPCPDMAFNLYDPEDGSKITGAAACPNCYYPSLPRDSSAAAARMGTTTADVMMGMGGGGGDHRQHRTTAAAARIVVNPADSVDRSRRNRRYGPASTAPYHCRGMLDPEHYQTTETLMNPNVIRNDFPVSSSSHQGQRNLRFENGSRTLDNSSQRQQHRRHKRNKNCSSNRAPAPIQQQLQTFTTPSPQSFILVDSANEDQEMYRVPTTGSTHSIQNCL
ncbi:hypothetical protein BV898_02290 [Hypsibius exemplaris]|uniref:Uncharacterized protein n=1 Tax=Hypsibius exemplaris TaxID=2072580 RepID=A0A1W0X8W0_HYPEX|nr:hypothetical protein BV898_02290 [Hypsibius exemplaris]